MRTVEAVEPTASMRLIKSVGAAEAVKTVELAVAAENVDPPGCCGGGARARAFGRGLECPPVSSI